MTPTFDCRKSLYFGKYRYKCQIFAWDNYTNMVARSVIQLLKSNQNYAIQWFSDHRRSKFETPAKSVVELIKQTNSRFQQIDEFTFALYTRTEFELNQIVNLNVIRDSTTTELVFFEAIIGEMPSVKFETTIKQSNKPIITKDSNYEYRVYFSRYNTEELLQGVEVYSSQMRLCDMKNFYWDRNPKSKTPKVFIDVKNDSTLVCLPFIFPSCDMKVYKIITLDQFNNLQK